jgi:hypothetical protein
VAPHHVGATPAHLIEHPHLLRFYSAPALASLLREEGLDPEVILEPVDVLSHQNIRWKCLQLAQDGELRAQRPPPLEADWPRAWATWQPREAWACALGAPGGALPPASDLSVIFAQDPAACVQRGAGCWSQATECPLRDVPGDTPEWLLEAARKGIAVLEDSNPALRAFEQWTYKWAQHAQPRCVVIGPRVIYGIHLPISRVVFYDMPSSFEAVAHLCGRTARVNACQDAQVVFASAKEARLAMVPPVEHVVGGG